MDRDCHNFGLVMTNLLFLRALSLGSTGYSSEALLAVYNMSLA